MKRSSLLVSFLTFSTGAAPQAGEPVTLDALIALDRPKPSVELSYGESSSQKIDIFLPKSEGIGDLKAFAPQIPKLCGPGILEL
jgi:hypothetical protein